LPETSAARISCIPTCSCWAALAVNGASASAEAAAKAWRRVTRLFIIPLLAVSSSSAVHEIACFEPQMGATLYRECARRSPRLVAQPPGVRPHLGDEAFGHQPS